MKKFLFWTLIIAILLSAAYLTLIPLPAGKILTIKTYKGRLKVITAPGTYIHIPLKEKWRIYPSQIEVEKVTTYIKGHNGGFSVNFSLFFSINNPVKFFPGKVDAIKATAIKKSIKFFSRNNENFIQTLLNPPLITMKGTNGIKILIYKITPEKTYVEEKISEAIEIIKHLEENLKKKKLFTANKILIDSKLMKEKILQQAVTLKKELENRTLKEESQIVSQIKYPKLWFLLKELDVYSSVNTNATLYINLPLFYNNPKRR